MNRQPAKYKIGYGRPPEQTRWLKGQCGNPGRIRKDKPMDVSKMIEDAFGREIDIVEGDRPRRVTVFEAIVLQLWTKAIGGNVRALNVFFKYQDFARTRGGVGGIEIRVMKDDT